MFKQNYIEIIQMSNPTCLPSHLRASNIKRLEEEFQENQNRIKEKIENLQMKIEMLGKYQSIKNMKQFTLNRERLSRLFDTKQDMEREYANRYLKSKVELEEGTQYKKTIKDLQSRLMQVRTNLFDKEVEITVDHIGKKREERVCVQNINRFNNHQVQKQNIMQLLNLKHRTQLSIQIDKTKSAVGVELNDGKTNPENETIKERPLLLVSSETQLIHDKKFNYNDPLLSKLIRLYQRQCQRQKQICFEIDRVNQQYKLKSTQNAKLYERLSRSQPKK